MTDSYFLKIMQDTKGDPSSKRWMGFIAFFFMIFTLVADVFFNIEVAEYIFNGFVWLAAIGIGAVTVEHFAKNFGKKKDEVEEEPEEEFIIARKQILNEETDEI